MEHALLRRIKGMASLLLIMVTISINILGTFLPQLSEPESLHENRILDRDFHLDEGANIVEKSKAVIGKISAAKNSANLAFSSIKSGRITISLESKGSENALYRDDTTSERSNPLAIQVSEPSFETIGSSRNTIKSSAGISNGIFMNGSAHNRYHIKRFRRSNPETTHATRFDSIYNPLIKSHTTRHFPYKLCRGWGLIMEPTRAPVVPTPPPTNAAQMVPTSVPIVPIVPVVVPEIVIKSFQSYATINRLAYHGVVSNIQLDGKPKRIIHRPGALTGYNLLFAKTRAPDVPETSAPTPLPTRRVFHRICQDGRVIEIDGTQGPTVLPTVAPTYSPVTQETRPPAFVSYVWGNGYGMTDNAPRWSFAKNQNKILFDHPNIKRAIINPGSLAPLSRQFKRRVDTLSPW